MLTHRQVVDAFLAVHDPVALGAEFAEVRGAESGEHKVRGILLDVGGKAERSRIERVEEGIASEVGVGVAVTDHKHRRRVGHVGEVEHHRLRAREAGAAREIGGVAVAE